MVSFGNDELKPHFIYCGHYYMSDRFTNFKKMFLKKMKKFGIQSSMLTLLSMERRNLITKEKAKEASEGKLYDKFDWDNEKISINDDLEMFLENILNPKEIYYRAVSQNSFFTPKLTEEELKLVEEKNEDHLKTYVNHHAGYNPDVDPYEMKKSDSKSKYVHARCSRWTYSLTLQNKESCCTII